MLVIRMGGMVLYHIRATREDLSLPYAQTVREGGIILLTSYALCSYLNYEISPLLVCEFHDGKIDQGYITWNRT